MDNEELLKKALPFGGLIAPSTLIVAVLYLAGFSYLWSYYYNFGLQNLVFDFTFQSLLITSLEMIRQPRTLLTTAASLIGALVCVNLILRGVSWAGRSAHPSFLRGIVAAIINVLALESPLVTDAIRVLVLIYVVYALSASIGYARFRADIVNAPGNPLPVVTAIMETSTNEAMVLACGGETKSPVNLIGDKRTIRVLLDQNQTCSLNGRVWRLLHRDDKAVYLFATGPSEIMADGRPLTIVLPNTDKLVLVMGMSGETQ